MDDYNLLYLFQLPRTEAKKSQHFKPMGAVITKRGIAISYGHNKIKTHPKYANGKDFYTIHAEIDAMIHCRTDLNNSNIWVYRETAQGKPAMAKPCNNCLKYLIEAGIKRIFYTVPKYPYYEVINLT